MTETATATATTATTTTTNIVNKGTGAGGAATNANGLSYEERTSFERFLPVEKEDSFGSGKNDEYKIYNIEGERFIKVVKSGLKNIMGKSYNNKCEKSLQPDEAFISHNKKTIFILEKKFQQSPGSVDEKIQTGLFKYEFYCQQYPTYEIKDAYVLSDWFKQDRYSPEMRFNKKYNITVFWGSDEKYFDNVKEWLLN